MRKLAVALVFLLAGYAPLRAAGVLPPLVEARAKQDARDCSMHDAKFEKGFMTRKDVNGDGIADYILDYGHFSCGGSHTFCGSGGCTMAIYASKGGQFVVGLDQLIQGMTFKTIGGRPAVQLGLHGSACG